MSATITVNDRLLKALQLFGETNIEKQMSEFLQEILVNKLKACNDQVLPFEVKYGMSFSEFDRAWDAGLIPNPHCHEVESDYIDWEALELEKRKILGVLVDLRRASDDT
ncbi:MAG: hypothetical protein O7E52_21410 [Candidatus Poribacteria bacterium]|nr:hypothetical protein [Candidatus Poribacteria bacterium]